MNKTTKKIGEALYSGSASVGTITTTISLIMGIIIAIIMIIIGVIIVKKRLKSVSGTATSDSICSTVEKDTNCSTEVTYTVAGKTYTSQPIDTGTAKFNNGEKVTVYYSASTPDKPVINPVPVTMGWMLIVFAILIILVVSLNYYFARKSKAYAAVTGVNAIL
jgi:uncharacterized membrane protein